MKDKGGMFTNQVARTIYMTHWKEGLPQWEQLTPEFRAYVWKQAAAVADFLSELPK